MSTNKDRTAAYLRAFLASMRPLPDCDGISDDDSYQRGRSMIERLAISASGDDAPTAHLIGCDVANVLAYLSSSMPIEPRNWWNDPEDGPSHVVGFKMLLEALEASLRDGSTPSAAGGTQPLCRLLFRLQAASWKLDLARDHWSDPRAIVGEDMGAICVVREVAKEIGTVYGDLVDWAKARGQDVSFDDITSFDFSDGRTDETEGAA